MEIYVVRSGDNVDTIANWFRVPVDELIYDNQIPYPYRLAIGQALLINDRQKASNRRRLHSSGYAYPFINADTLQETLPWLTDLFVFSYGFTAEGELVHPMTDDAWMVEASLEGGVRPMMTLTPLDANGNFNNHLITSMVNSIPRQERLIMEMKAEMRQKGFMGVNIDFEYVLAADREAFTGFVARVTRSMRADGYEVSAALAPKTSRDQEGVLYEGIDYQLLGAITDRVILMTYEWGYTYGPPMAVAPLNMVRRVVEYALTEIPAEKISLGIPNYGYDWPLPYERGTTKARTINNVEAVQIAVNYGAEILFDETAMSPYFYYWDRGVQHVVWFEDVRSLRAKYELVNEYRLTGVCFWQLMQLFRASWILMDGMFYIIREL